MRTTVHTFLTLDGVMQAPGGAEEDPQGGFRYGGWIVPFVDQDFNEIATSWFERTDAVLLGRTTYEIMKPYWSSVTDPDNAAARLLNDGRKYVVSTTMQSADGGDTTILRSLERLLSEAAPPQRLRRRGQPHHGRRRDLLGASPDRVCGRRRVHRSGRQGVPLTLGCVR